MRKRKSSKETNSWPGFVDALSALLLIFMFMMAIFAVISFSLGRSSTTKDEWLSELSAQVKQKEQEVQSLQSIVSSLNESLSFAESENLEVIKKLNEALGNASNTEDADKEINLYKQQIIALEATRNKLLNEVTNLRNQQVDNDDEIEQARANLAKLQGDVARSKDELNDQVAVLTADLKKAQDEKSEFENLSLDLQSQIVVLKNQLDTLTGQLARVETALETKEQIISDQKVEIANLGQRINEALLEKVGELQAYRSDFLAALKQSLGDNNEDLSVVGDRFVISSGILFSSASAALNDEGSAAVTKLAGLIKDIETKIPSDVNWIIRVDGHTDKIPYRGPNYKDNWELSSARALSVVRQLIAQGVSPNRLMAAGFGEYHPIVISEKREEFAKNRRIEIKLTEK